jgi:hypothetical protein
MLFFILIPDIFINSMAKNKYGTYDYIVRAFFYYGTPGRIRNPLEQQRDFADAQPADLVQILPEAQKKQVMVFSEPLPASFSWYAR